VTGVQVVHIPLPKNRQFVGRRAELEILKRRMFEAPECQRLAVFGPSGIGKTQLALSFAYWVVEHHPEISVFWIAAPSADAFERAVQKIAQQLWLLSAADQSEDGKDLLKLHLSTSSTGKWLLIVDNADDAEIFKASTRSDSLLRYLPESPLGVTVFTTRSSSVAHHLAGKETLELEEMTSDEAAELLEAVIVDADSLKDPVANAKFLAELGHMPLAIKQAAAYINDPKLSVSDFSRISRSAGFAFSSALDNMDQTAQRRPRRNVAPYAYPVADISTVQYALGAIDSPPTSSSPGDFSPSVESAMKPTRLRRIRPCYLMCVLGFLAIGGSLAVGLFYSIAQDRMGDGSTTAGWMVAVSTLMLAAPMAKHYPNCRC
jgi:energy-coupling factor transporter ATP-binding protein EcfA2